MSRLFYEDLEEGAALEAKEDGEIKLFIKFLENVVSLVY